MKKPSSSLLAAAAALAFLLAPLGLRAHGGKGVASFHFQSGTRTAIWVHLGKGAVPEMSGHPGGRLSPTPVHSGKGSVAHGAAVFRSPLSARAFRVFSPKLYRLPQSKQATLALAPLRAGRSQARPVSRFEVRRFLSALLQSPSLPSSSLFAGWPRQWPIRPPPF